MNFLALGIEADEAWSLARTKGRVFKIGAERPCYDAQPGRDAEAATAPIGEAVANDPYPRDLQWATRAPLPAADDGPPQAAAPSTARCSTACPPAPGRTEFHHPVSSSP
jgi:hypothetical protein